MASSIRRLLSAVVPSPRATVPALLFTLFALVAPGVSGAPMRPEARSLLESAVAYTDPLWDDRCAFVWAPVSRENPSPRRRTVRGTAAYAVGLLARDHAGDRERAARAIEAVLSQQIAAPGEPWDGTFYRAPDEPNPPLFARLWDDYDPNWRQFIGTAWALILLEFTDRIPAELVPRLEDSIRRAIEGEIAHGRLKPEYTNIALMHSFLLAFGGQRLNRPEWITAGDELAAQVYALFKQHDAFEEYNSPTYYGVDFYGLALWRAHGVTDRMRRLGNEMEAALWRETALYYHAGLRNICGPFDRGYGMDMTHYASLTGLWLGLVLDPKIAPVPVPNERMEHAHDHSFVTFFAVLGASIPEDAMRHFVKFQGERMVERQITPWRTATAWLGQDVMLGGQVTQLSRAAGFPYSQFYPATIHWKRPDGGIGWVLLRRCSRIDARATPNRLDIQAIGDAIFRISSPGTEASQVGRNTWKLNGLTVQVDTDATGFEAVRGEYWIDVTYKDATRFVLRTEKSP